MRLYEIAGDLQNAIFQYNTVESDEDLQRVEEVLNALSMKFEEKCVGVAHYILTLRGETDVIDKEIARLEAMKKAKKAEVEWLERYLMGNMQQLETTDVRGDTVRIRLKLNPPSVNITDPDAIPAKFCTEKVTVAPSKTLIKEAIEAGEAVPGATIERKRKLEIK